MLPQGKEDDETDVSLLTDIHDAANPLQNDNTCSSRLWVLCDDGKWLWLPLPIDGSPPR